eukprot:CAMPEP_0119522068 /NCGR_PEP_ID=MMETSP1344-20130328/37563_1 /TAXON_ID=236787 /ORGANISM="Florenciella parvula, Strain CCMP2471" /LENGTH=46 /DNA_ID= /DNA_START= /DNA_END= /DNA_ORIENTATION=
MTKQSRNTVLAASPTTLLRPSSPPSSPSSTATSELKRRWSTFDRER